MRGDVPLGDGKGGSRLAVFDIQLLSRTAALETESAKRISLCI